MVDIHKFSKSQLIEIAGYIKEDTLDVVNQREHAFQPKDTFYTRYGKRFLDILISGAALLVTAPINLVIAVITYFDVGRPLIFQQVRVGKDRKEFVIYKFRNMTNETDANGELLPPEERVTKWGKFVRKTSLDELMNFVSVFKGDMSLIGPRPLIRSYVGRLHSRHLMMYSVRPGLECPILKKLDHPASWQDRLDNYVWYAENVSLLVDVKMVFRMVSLVFESASSSKRSVSKNGAVLGYDMDGNVIDSNAVPEKYVEKLLDNYGYKSVEEAIENRYSNCGELTVAHV